MNSLAASILERSYQKALSNANIFSELSDQQRGWVEEIIEKAESQKAVLAVLITSLTKKIESPSQDVRSHKKELLNGYSGRGYDTQHVTPFIRDRFPRFAMKGGSGWLTRSLEQAHPYTLDYPGRIRDISVRESFLQILNDVEENQADPNLYLCAVFVALNDVVNRTIADLDNMSASARRYTLSVRSKSITIDEIMNLLRQQLSFNYGVAGASRLPVLAVFSAYEMLMSIERYRNKTLQRLKFHTVSDAKSGGIGDIEVLDEKGNYFEAVEIKHNITISSSIVDDAYHKFSDAALSRYYILTTAENDIDDRSAVNDSIRRIRDQHGCEVIVNGILPSIKYYLRLLSDPTLFLDYYTKNIRSDFMLDANIKDSHIRYWNELLQSAQ